MKATIILLLAIVLNARSYGKIGETFEQCVKRYGAPIEARDNKSKAEFRVDGVRIICWFESNECTSISYDVRYPIGENAKDYAFTFEQCVKILNLNSGSAKWVQKTKEPYGSKWDGIYHDENEKLRASIYAYSIAIETIELRDKEMMMATPEKVDAALAKFGADQSKAMPLVQAGHLPPTKEELEDLEFKKRLNDLESSSSQ
jgi:hypothetical protein